MGKPEDVKSLSDKQIEDELLNVGAAWDRMIIGNAIAEAQLKYGPRFHALLDEQKERKLHSSVAVVRLRFLAGDTGRDLDAACAEALGWRVSRDQWWNWHPGPVFDPPGDEWCIRRDGRNDTPCDEALPSFTEALFEQELRAAIRKGSD